MERTGFLAEMYEAARARAALVREAHPRRPQPRPSGPSFIDALRHPRHGGLAVIAEIKRASPSKGVLAADLDAAAQAAAYQAGGADAVSVLTEPQRFHGSLDDLRAAVGACDLPVLRKDFLVDECQVWEASAAGAAAVLLIVALLETDRLVWLYDEAHELGLDVLLELHDEHDVEVAQMLAAPLVGINNRDLGTLRVDLATTERLAALLRPAGDERVIVAESGIVSGDDARRMRRAGASAVLVGEALVRDAGASTLGERVDALRGEEGRGSR